MIGDIHTRVSGEAGKFLARAQAIFASDDRFSALLVAGSTIEGATDEFSDLDLIVISPEAAYGAVMGARRQIAESLGSLHAAFTGEHVGEPRLLICLYGDPLLHVDLKFVTVDDLDRRVETPLVAWSRDPAVLERLRSGTSEWPNRPPEWFEERFWIWVHYGATKIGRGENMEAIHMLDFLRDQVLGPLIARSLGRDQRGVRHLERLAPGLQKQLEETLCSAEKGKIKRAYLAAIALYRDLRAGAIPDNLRVSRESAVCSYVESV